MSSVVSETKLLARHSSVYAAGTILQRVGALLLLPLYTSYLTPTDYGVKELLAISIDVISILMSTAVSSAVFRFYFEEDDKVRRNLVMSTAAISLSAAGLVVLAGLLPLSGFMAGLVLDDSSLARYFTLSLAALWFQMVNRVSYDWLRANQKSLQFVVISLAKFLLTVGLNIYFVAVLEFGVLGILWSTLISSVIVFLALTVPMFTRIGLNFDLAFLRRMLSFGWPLIFSQFGGFVVHLSDRFFLKAYCSVAEAGIYSLGYRFGTVPSQFISGPFNQTWLPRRFEVAKDPAGEQIFGRIFTYYLTLIFFVGLLVAGLTLDVLRVIADSMFWSAASVVPVIVLANIIFTFHYHFNIGLMLEKKTKHLAVLNLTNAALVLLLNWWLIPQYAAMGAAMATLVAFTFKSLATYFLGRRYYRIHFEWLRVAKLLAVAAAVFLGVSLLDIDEPLLAVVIKGGLILAAYPLLLLVARFFSGDELARARQIIGQRMPGRSR